MSDSSDYGASQSPASPYAASASSPSPYQTATDLADGYQPYSRPTTDPANSSSPEAPRPIFGNGVNLQPSYQNQGDVDLSWVLMAPFTTIRTVRLEIESSAVDAAVRWIREAVARKYQVIATYHDFEAIHDRPASEDGAHMDQAIRFWQDNYARLAAAGPFIMNFMNEWGHKDIKPKDYADQYNKAIAAVRQFYRGPIIIDVPGSGQMISTAAAAVKGTGGITPIADTNIILSAHLYPNAWNGKGPLTSADLDLLESTGRPCMIGEFGENNEKPGTDWRQLVTDAKGRGWPVLAWAWAGDGGIMNIVLPEFQPYVPGKPDPNYYINNDYANIVLPYLK